MHYGEAELLPFGSLGYGQTAAQKIAAKQARQGAIGAKGGSGPAPSRTQLVYIQELGESIEVPSLSRLSAALQKAGYEPGKAAIFANQIQQAYIAGDLSSLNTQPILKSIALQFAQEQIVTQQSQIELERLQNIQASIGTDAELASQYLQATDAEAAALAESERQRLAAEAAAAEARFQRNKKIALGILGVSVLGYFAYRFTR